MGLKKFFGVFVILMGITMTILNVTIMLKVKNTCKNNTTIKNTNMGNFVLGILLTFIGLIVYISGYFGNDNSMNFGFG
jgi:uncharacterized membrane protein